MTHWMTLDDWDSDGINPQVLCDCHLREDHYQDTGKECRDCSAILDERGRCWYCDRQRGRIWSEGT
jgi:hypothetical protein